MPAKPEAIIDGVSRLNELVRNMHRSKLLAQEHPATLDAITELHKALTAGAGQEGNGDPDAVDLRDMAEAYSQDNDSHGRFLQILHEAIRVSAPLSSHHPDKGLQEHAVHEDRLSLMTYVADEKPNWLRVYRNLGGEKTLSRRERLALAEAFGGHSIGSMPINRLLASAGEIIDLMESLPDQSSQKKAAWLGTEYDAFEAQYGFDPARIIAVDTKHDSPQGTVTQSTLSWWNTLDQREERMVIETAPGAEQMPFSQLIESAAQSRWSNPIINTEAGRDVAAFCGSVLERSLPERLAGTPAGERMEMLSEAVEAAMVRYAPSDYQNWLQRDVLSNVVVPITEDKIPMYFAEHGYTHQVGNSGHVAATPIDSASPASVRYLLDDGVLLVTHYANSEGMRTALNQDYPGAAVQADKFLPPAKRVHLKALESKLTSLGVSERADKLALLLSGELAPEDVPETSSWIRQCYNRPSDEELEMHAANVLLEGHGVEMISALEIGDGMDPCIEYVNQGDPYIPTLAWHDGEVFFTGYGDLLEAIEQRQADEREGRDWSKLPYSNPNPMPESLTPLVKAAAEEYARQNEALEHQAFSAPTM